MKGWEGRRNGDRRRGGSPLCLSQVYKERKLVGELVDDLDVQTFERKLRELIEVSAVRPSDPLRIVGVGATRQAYETGTDGRFGGGGGFSGRGGPSGGRSMSAE